MKFNIKTISFLLSILLAQCSWSHEDFYMAMTADPQLTWACAPGSLCKQHANSVEGEGIVSNRWQAESINSLIAQYGASFKGVIVNGDLTSFGHKNEFEQYLKYFRNLIKAPIYEGLGNHDYSNNINDCFNNNCAQRMVAYLYGRLSSKPKGIKNYDFKAGSLYFKAPYLRKDYRGSLSYSFDIEGVHFIQLNFHPAYQRNFDFFNFKAARMEHYHITPAFDWLEKDLKQARDEGKTIIVNLHDVVEHLKPENKERLKDLLIQYKVSGLFSGHIHQRVGRSTDMGSIPTFRCGSSPYNTYLLAHFQNNKLSDVSVIKSDYGNVSYQDTYLIENINDANL